MGNKDETKECHAFLCRKRKIAQAATMTIAQAFNLAFESWKQNQGKEKEDAFLNGKSISKSEQSCNENESQEHFMKLRLNDGKNDPANKDSDETSNDEDDLIDFNSPGDTLDDKTSSALLVNIETEETKDMDENFSKLPHTPTNVPMLKHLPSNAASLSVCAFVGSQTLLDSPSESPLHGSSLTPTQLATPECSPCTQVRLLNRLEKVRNLPPSPLASPKLVN